MVDEIKKDAKQIDWTVKVVEALQTQIDDDVEQIIPLAVKPSSAAKQIEKYVDEETLEQLYVSGESPEAAALAVAAL